MRDIGFKNVKQEQPVENEYEIRSMDNENTSQGQDVKFNITNENQMEDLEKKIKILEEKMSLKEAMKRTENSIS